jgi:hypothetical protein
MASIKNKVFICKLGRKYYKNDKNKLGYQYSCKYLWKHLGIWKYLKI